MSPTDHPADNRKTIRTTEGPVSYLDTGTGPTLVFLHGTLANANTWRKLTPHLSDSYRCIQPDLPIGGHHLPLGKKANLAPPGIAQLVEDFLDALDLDNVVLIGNDTGGAYAQVHAANHRARLRGLILSNTDCLDVFPPKQFKSMPRLIGIPGYTKAMAALFRRKTFAAGPSVLGLLSNTLTSDEIRTHYLNNFITRPDIRPNLAAAAKAWSTRHTLAAAASLADDLLPTLLCWGTDDQLFPLALGQQLAKAIPHSKFVTIEDSSTYIQEDRPAAFAAEIHRFASALGTDSPQEAAGESRPSATKT